MLFIALLVALAAVVFAVVVLAEEWGGATYAIHGFGHLLGNLTLAGVFLSGIIITAVFFVALWLASLSSMMRRRASNRRRAESRAAREEHEGLLTERDRLARELQAERAARANAAGTGAAAAGAAGAGTAGSAGSAGSRTIDLDERERLAHEQAYREAYPTGTYEEGTYDQRAADDAAHRHTV